MCIRDRGTTVDANPHDTGLDATPDAPPFDTGVDAPRDTGVDALPFDAHFDCGMALGARADGVICESAMPL